MINREKGFTLIEAMVATFILVVAVIGAYLAFSQTIIATSLLSYRLTAAYLAQEGIEVVRNIRDTNWVNPEAGDWNQVLNTCIDGCQVDYKTGTLEQNETIESGSYYLSSYNEDPLKIDSNGFYDYVVGTEVSPFRREITITSIDEDTLDVVVTVYWDIKGHSYNVSAEEYLYNWK